MSDTRTLVAKAMKVVAAGRKPCPPDCGMIECAECQRLGLIHERLWDLFAAAHAEGASAAQQWQPISSVPSEGRPFLVQWQPGGLGHGSIDVVSPAEYREILGYGESPAQRWMPIPLPELPR